MANPIPCAMCIEVPDSDFLITNRLEMPWPFDQSTVGLCLTCFLQLGVAMGEAIQAAMKAEAEPGRPGVLEAVEADEGTVTPARADSKSRKPKVSVPAAPQVGPAETAPEGDPDDLG